MALLLICAVAAHCSGISFCKVWVFFACIESDFSCVFKTSTLPIVKFMGIKCAKSEITLSPPHVQFSYKFRRLK